MRVTINCIVGPHTNVSARLTQLSSSVRLTPGPAEGSTNYYARGPSEARFIDYVGSGESIVTSHGNADPGRLDFAAEPDELRPFEWRGVIGRWRLELPTELPEYDRLTISDVVLHIDSVEWPVDEASRAAADTARRELLTGATDTAGPPLGTILSLKYALADAWHNAARGGDFEANLRLDHTCLTLPPGA